MGKITLRRLHRAPEKNIAWLAGCVGAGADELYDRYSGDNQEVVALYGGDESLDAVASTALKAGVQVYRSGQDQSREDHCPAAILAGSRSRFKDLADALAASETETGEQLLRCLGRHGPKAWKIGGNRELVLNRTLIMGVLNLTPDSFYPGSRVQAVQEALRRAVKMAGEGADIIDLGGESTRPGAEVVEESEEIARIVPVIEAISGQLGPVPISVDTYKAAVAAAALDAGASIVNDIGAGLLDKAMLTTVAGRGAGYVMMHMRGRPRTMQQDTTYDDLLGEIHRFFRHGLERCDAAGIAESGIVLDPGIGFGKPAAGNYEIIARLGEFSSLGRALLVGASRKSFLALAGQQDSSARLEGSLAACTVAVLAGAKIVRVHDVAPAHRAVKAAEVFAAHMSHQ